MIHFITKDKYGSAQVCILPELVRLFEPQWLDADRVLISQDGSSIVFEGRGSRVTAHVPDHLRTYKLTPPMSKALGLS